jgi:hypothetical protein
MQMQQEQEAAPCLETIACFSQAAACCAAEPTTHGRKPKRIEER